MIRFKTETGSTYEMDRAHRRIRRLDGVKAPTERQGADGIWKEYADAKLEMWRPCVIVWRYDETAEGQVARCTETSRVIEIEGASS